ncbi:hypothetical protein IW140_004165 [Coemansia sp. RSA 1813]|nr:hypothetical protein EV178_002290 [Coemansia sp. RSA 1646]KAJ1769572.1 hypothetical protein LPJ74_003934 [Coemansia sp. RSA 1843]KAJ2216991.1 hypothetical protein EV179_000757 [Coemansia sp. RSA 487]KAJ2568077.1 hypothetical protein IW140_004165 [Coemansia sp. RSA 1813]
MRRAASFSDSTISNYAPDPLQTVGLVSRDSIDSTPHSPVSDINSDNSETHYVPSTESLIIKGGKSHSHFRGLSCFSTANHKPQHSRNTSIGSNHYDAGSESPKPSVPLRLRLSFIGLFFTIFLSGLDQTVTSTILTRIANDFKALDRVEWVPTVFMLCSTCLNIISGRIADTFGRFNVLMFSLAAFIAGAVISTWAPSIVVFIVARGISGIACGGMLNLSIIIISDIVPIERRGKYLGFLQVCFGAANAAGPLIGGLFADRVSWRAAFFTDMIMGVVTIVYLAVILRLPKMVSAATIKEGIRRLDCIGIVVVSICISLVIVGLNIGGTTISWSSPITISCLAVGGAMLGVFIVVELKVARAPLVPMWVFRVRNLVVPFAVTFMCAMTMFTIVFFLPVYFSAVFGVNAMVAGFLSLPFGVALGLSSFVSGYMMSKKTSYRTFLRIGPGIMAVGAMLIALLSGKVPRGALSALLVIPGAGMGNVIVSNVIAAQAAVEPQFVVLVTPLCEFFLSIGGVIGVAIFGAVYRTKLSKLLIESALGEPAWAQAIINEARKDVSVVYTSDIPDTLREKIAHAYASSISLGFWTLFPFVVLAFAISMLLRKDPKPVGGPEEIPLQPVNSAEVHV